MLDIPGFSPPGGAAIPCSGNIKAAREENAVFPALKSSIGASLGNHSRTRRGWYCVTILFSQFLYLSVR
jgi:hypothetical protein